MWGYRDLHFPHSFAESSDSESRCVHTSGNHSVCVPCRKVFVQDSAFGVLGIKLSVTVNLMCQLDQAVERQILT